MQRGATTLNGLDVHWLECGPTDGPLAVLLHGFPDSAHTWRHLAPALAAAGHHVVAPWLRGYAPTGLAPDGSYQVGALAGDASALADHFGADDAVLIGHDWGAITGYAAVGWQPERWRRLVTLAVPPLAAVVSGFLTFRQVRRSWYMFVFQHDLATGIVAADDMVFLDGLWEEWSPGFDAGEDVANVKDALRDHAHLEAALGYYRAMLGDTFKSDELAEIDAFAYVPSPVPTLYLHGANDGCMGTELLDGVDAYLPDPASRVEIVDGAGHFLHLERPDIVNPMIVDFVTS